MSQHIGVGGEVVGQVAAVARLHRDTLAGGGRGAWVGGGGQGGIANILQFLQSCLHFGGGVMGGEGCSQPPFLQRGQMFEQLEEIRSRLSALDWTVLGEYQLLEKNQWAF